MLSMTDYPFVRIDAEERCPVCDVRMPVRWIAAVMPDGARVCCVTCIEKHLGLEKVDQQHSCAALIRRAEALEDEADGLEEQADSLRADAEGLREKAERMARHPVSAGQAVLP